MCVYVFRWNTLTGGYSCLVAPGVSLPPGSTETLVGGRWVRGIVRALTHCIMKKIYVYTHILEHIRGSLNKFSNFFFVWTLLLIVYTWNSSPLWINLLRLQCTFCTVLTTSGRPQGSPLVWACQWPSSPPLSSPQLSHNDSHWAEGIPKSHWGANFPADQRDRQDFTHILNYLPSTLSNYPLQHNCPVPKILKPFPGGPSQLNLATNLPVPQ